MGQLDMLGFEGDLFFPFLVKVDELVMNRLSESYYFPFCAFGDLA